MSYGEFTYDKVNHVFYWGICLNDCVEFHKNSLAYSLSGCLKMRLIFHTQAADDGRQYSKRFGTDYTHF